MTRDQAIEKIVSIEHCQTTSAFFVDALVTLGMLKLEEPKSVDLNWELAKAFRDWERDSTGRTLMHFVDKAGFKIVSK